MNKILEETKEFFKVFEWPSGNKLSTSIISKISDNNLIKLRKSMKETFPSEYEKAMKKIPDDNELGNDDDDLDDIDLSRFGIENNNDKENSQPIEVKDKRSIIPNKLKKLVDKFKNDKKFKRNVLIGAAALAIVAGVAIYTAVTGDNSLSQNIDVNSFVSNSNGINFTNTPADEFVKATIQNYDPNALASAGNVDLSSVNLGDISFGLDGLDQIYSNAADAANLSGGLTPDVSAGNVSLADLYNNATGEWMNIDPSSLSIDELKELVSSGDYSVAYTNDPSLIGQGGETLANSNLITGFDNAEHYIDMVEEATKSAGGRTL